MEKNTRIHLIAEGSVAKALFTLSAPAIVGMMVIAVYNIADTFFVSLLRDTAAVAATGIVFPVFQLIGAIGLTFGMGAASVISRRLGEKRHEDAQRSASIAFYSAAIVGLLFAVFGSIYIRPLLHFFGATESILEVAVLYGRLIIGGSIFQVLNMALNNMLRSEGAALHSSIGQVIGAVLNIILDPLCIFFFDMGVSGAALATVIAQACAFLFLSSYYLRGKGVISPLKISSFRLDLSSYGDIMALGFPTFVRQVLGSVSFAFVNNAAAVFGDETIAAVSVTFRIFMLFIMGLLGLAQGLQPLIGYNYGAGSFTRVQKGMRLSFISAIAVALFGGSIGLLFAPEIIAVFTPQDPEVIRLGSWALRAMSLASIPISLVIIFGGIFQALGDGRSALLLAAGQQGLFLIPLIFLLPRIFGVYGVLAAQPAGFLCAFFVGALLFYRAHTKLLKRQG